MNPEEKELLRRALTLSEENNTILKKLERHVRWQSYWGFIKILIFVVPLILGYLLLQPYLGSALNTYQEVRGLINNPENPSESSRNGSITPESLRNLLQEI
jgi:hypothetical protein